MKHLKLIILIMFFFLNIFKITANEKEVISTSTEKQAVKSDFSFVNYNKAGETEDIKFYQRKANGFLVMGLTGVCLTSLGFSSEIACFVLLLKGIWLLNTTFTIFLFLLAPLIVGGAGIPIIAVGFYAYNKFKNTKAPDPFINSDKDKKFKLGLVYKI